VRNCGFNYEEVPPLPPGSRKELVEARARKLQLNDARGFIRLMKKDWKATLNEANNMANDCKCNCKEIIARFECGSKPSAGMNPPRLILETARFLLAGKESWRFTGAFPDNTFDNLSPTFKQQVPYVPTCGIEIPFKCKQK
jgi:hypothetical protein